ncbi:MAG TPA: hypothetical protein VF897_00395 [Roseiflexaceae bacterium]
MHKPDVDPDLERQLDAAQDGEPVEAVLLLRHADSRTRRPIDAEALMARVWQQDQDAEMNYMPRLGALIVRTRSDVIRMLLGQPEVETASANRNERELGL